MIAVGAVQVLPNARGVKLAKETERVVREWRLRHAPIVRKVGPKVSVAEITKNDLASPQFKDVILVLSANALI
jgi:hypothetical protein